MPYYMHIIFVKNTFEMLIVYFSVFLYIYQRDFKQWPFLNACHITVTNVKYPYQKNELCATLDLWIPVAFLLFNPSERSWSINISFLTKIGQRKAWIPEQGDVTLWKLEAFSHILVNIYISLK